MLPIRWSQSAGTDAKQVFDFLAERSESSALRMLEKIGQALDRLSRHPNLYREGRIAGTREMVIHENYIIVYRVHVDEIEIVSFLHSRRNYRADS